MNYTALSASERQFVAPAVAVSTIAFALRPPAGAQLGVQATAVDAPGTLWIPLVRRTRPPFRDHWALPGGPIPWNEGLAETAERTVHDATRRAPGYLEQLYAFGAPERSAEAQRLVTIAYWALYGERELEAEPSLAHDPSEVAPDEPRRWDDPIHPAPDRRGNLSPAEPDPNVAWFPSDALPKLAFDHSGIVEYALWRLRLKTEYSAIAHRFLGPEFTLAQLRRVHEAIVGGSVDPANFRRQALAQQHLVDTGRLETGTPHRPARLYRFHAHEGSDTQPQPRSTS